MSIIIRKLIHGNDLRLDIKPVARRLLPMGDEA